MAGNAVIARHDAMTSPDAGTTTLRIQIVTMNTPQINEKDVTVSQSLDDLRVHIGRFVIGQTGLIDRLLIGLCCGGHLLIEGVPGLAKTTVVRALASGLALKFQRIQFTPDLIPGDITGSEIFLPQEGRFQFVAGPLFNDIILADEINRAPPKVQSALLEAMQERQITAGGMTRPLPDNFTVIATQNPIEHEGTYPLPEAQLDRFFMKVVIDYPAQDEELAILQQARDEQPAPETRAAVMSAGHLADLRRHCAAVYMNELLERYIVTLVAATRQATDWDETLTGALTRGASPRATLALARAARAQAMLRGRDFVEPGDIVDVAPDILRHRIALSFSARSQGNRADDIIQRLLDCIPIP